MGGGFLNLIFIIKIIFKIDRTLYWCMTAPGRGWWTKDLTETKAKFEDRAGLILG